jgi:hypothetical protein
MGFGGGRGVSVMALWNVAERLEKLERKLAERGSASEVRAGAAEKLRNNGTLTRKEVAAHLDVSTKKVWKLETKGLLLRCSNLTGVVRYRASDVLKLASAK